MRLKKNEQLSNFTNQLKIILTVIFSFWFIITLNACGIFVNTATSKSTELSEKYNFYEKSVNNIRTNCNVTPEQADEIFLVLVDNCGVSDLINYVFKNNDGTFSMYSSGKNYNVTLKDGIVSTVSLKHFFSDEQLYPKIENAQANNKPSEPTTIKETQPETTSQTQEPTTTEEETTEPEPTINEENNENDSNNNVEANENNNNDTEPYVTATTSANVFTYVLNTSTKKFHVPSCSEVKKIKDANYSEYTGTYDEVTSMGYVPCKKCH